VLCFSNATIRDSLRFYLSIRISACFIKLFKNLYYILVQNKAVHREWIPAVVIDKKNYRTAVGMVFKKCFEFYYYGCIKLKLLILIHEGTLQGVQGV
jgi:hypothetical protein